MRTLFCLFLAALSSSMASLHWSAVPSYTWEQYMRDFGRSYDPEEAAMRHQLFQAARDDVLSHNAKPGVSYKKTLNQFSDWTAEEFKAIQGYHKAVGRHTLATRAAKETFQSTGKALPASVDWRPYLSAIKDQGRCGSCWAFASTATVEAHAAIASDGEIWDLSPQQLVSCSTNPDECGGIGGCDGSIAQLAYDYLAQNGMTEAFMYGYATETYWGLSNGTCRFEPNIKMGGTPVVVYVDDHVSLPHNNQTAIMEALAFVGPLTVNVAAVPFQSYSEGVFDGCSFEDVDIDHVVQLVGYGTDPVHGDYWLVRNSWTPAWGEKGYIRMKRVADSAVQCGLDHEPLDGTGCKGGPASVRVCGMCGLLWDASYPTGVVPRKLPKK
jgi:cathepsin L